MLAFFGWTDLLLINHVNVKTSYYPSEKADLYVLKIPRVSMRLVDEIKKSSIFEAVYEIELLDWFDGKTKLQKVMGLLRREYVFQHYNKQINAACGFKKYQHFFTGAFWAESLHLFRSFFQNNRNLQISLVEEGSVSFCEPKGLTRCTAQRGYREKIIKYFHYFPWFVFAEKRIEYLYLYCPEIMTEDIKQNIRRMPQICKSSVVGGILKNIVSPIELMDYQKADYIFLVPFSANDENGESISLLREIVDGVGSKSQVMVRLHPNIKHIKVCLYNTVGKTVATETASSNIEGILFMLDIENKVFIAKNSSLLAIPRTMYGKTPWIVMTHNLYKKQQSYGVADTDLFEQLSLLYGDSEKLYAPKNKEEMINVLQGIAQLSSAP